MKKIILLALSAVVGILATSQLVFADTSTLYASPASTSATINAPFNISVKVNPAGNNVCVVKGNLIFSNLTCQNISVAPGLMPQISPTCASPNFIIGIPQCTTSAQNIFSVSVKGSQVGQASLVFGASDIIGVGATIPSISQSGFYNIVAVKPAVIVPPAKITPSANQTTVNINQQSATTDQTNQQPASSAPQTTDQTIITTSPETASVATAGTNYFWPIFIIFIIICIGLGIYYLSKNNKKTSGT